MRILTTAALIGLLTLVAFAGVWVVELMFDDRYQNAGTVVVLVACAQIPVATGFTYDQAALAAGD